MIVCSFMKISFYLYTFQYYFAILICNRCLIAICNSEGHVKVYRPPFCDFRAEWIEVCVVEVVNPVELEMVLSILA